MTLPPTLLFPPGMLPPRRVGARPIVTGRIDWSKSACGWLVFGLLGASASAATLLSSAEQPISGVQPAPASLFSPSSGRVVGNALPPSALAAESVVSSPVRPTPGPAERTAARTAKARPEAAPAPKKKARTQEPEERTAETHAPAVKPRVQMRPREIEPAEGREYKQPAALVTTVPDSYNVEFGWGWYNEYYFRGVNILRAVSSERENSGVFTGRAVLRYIRQDDTFTLGFNYWQALGRQQPKGGEFNVPPNKKDPRIDGAKVGSKFSLPPKDRYAEYNLNMAYTRTLIPGQLTGTVGYNRYMFGNGEFYKTATGRAIPYADESLVKLTYTGLQKIGLTPSGSWAHDFDGFNGDFFELRVDGDYALPVNLGHDLAVRIHPYVSLSYDMDYNGSDNGFNSVEFGADLPIQIASNLTLSFSANYVRALEDSEGAGRARSGFWGGVTLSAVWGGPINDSAVEKSAKKIVLAEDKARPWEFSLAASYQTVDYGFGHGRLPLQDPNDFYTHKASNPTRGFASPGSTRAYDDGTVFGRPTNNLVGAPGVFGATITNPFQLQGTPGSNAYARFSSSNYGYSVHSAEGDPKADDQDANVGPAVQLDREIIRKDKWSLRAGLSYGFFSSSGDSGYRLDRLDTLVETRNRFGYDYALDNFGLDFAALATGKAFPYNGLVIYDANAYANYLQNNGYVDSGTAGVIRLQKPQSELERTQAEVVKIGTFVRSSVDFESHELAIPISLRYDIGSRLHAEITVAPTLTIADADAKTELSIRALDDLADPQTHVFKRGNPPQAGIRYIGGGVSGGTNGVGGSGLPALPNTQPQQSTPLQLPPPVVPPVVSPVAASGKGATPQDVDYPGRTIANKRYNRSSVDALFGVKTQASLIFDLNEEKTIFAELSGGYRWVQEMHVSTAFGESSMDLSGFQASIGLGFRF